MEDSHYDYEYSHYIPKSKLKRKKRSKVNTQASFGSDLNANKPLLYSHNWITNKRTEVTEHKYDNDDYKRQNDEKIGILIVGTTGTGKSSLCGILSGDSSIRGIGGAERGSSRTQFIQSKYNPNIYFIDTMGTKDSDVNLTDEKILKSALEDVHQKRINKIKIIWTVGRETDKTDRKGPFNREAQFIGALQIKKGDKVDKKKGYANKIWTSVMIVQKRGKPFKSKKKISAILAAINDHGSTNEMEKDLNTHFFGFKCTNYSDDFETDNSEYEEWDPARRERKGYFTKERAREEINQRLNSLPLYEINFRKQKCTKCGVAGDSRYIEAPCHTKKIMLHNLSVSYRHPGEIRHFHNKGVIETNSGEWKYRYHPGNQTQKHTDVTEYKHTEAAKESSALGICQGMATSWHWHTDKWSKFYSCCNSYGVNATGCQQLYKCCGQHKSSVICVATAPTWSCCQKKSKEKGCKAHIQKVNKIYQCCGSTEGSGGCKMEYTCCRGIGNGCEAFYPCCDKRVIGKKYPPGCTAKCDGCRRDWGKQLDDVLPGGCALTKN